MDSINGLSLIDTPIVMPENTEQQQLQSDSVYEISKSTQKLVESITNYTKALSKKVKNSDIKKPVQQPSALSVISVNSDLKQSVKTLITYYNQIHKIYIDIYNEY